MASGHRKRKAELMAAYILAPAGLANPFPTDLTNSVSQTNLITTAQYEFGGLTPSFTEGSTTILSDSISNGDGNWTLMGYAGETTANTAGFLKTGTTHRYLQYPGTAQTVLTDSTPVLIYSKDGPQGLYNSAYLPTAAQVNGSGSLKFANQITSAFGALASGSIWIAGAVPTGTLGSTILVYTGANGNQGTALMRFSASVTPLKQSASFAYDATTAVTIIYSSSLNTMNLNSFVPGILVYISGSST